MVFLCNQLRDDGQLKPFGDHAHLFKYFLITLTAMEYFDQGIFPKSLSLERVLETPQKLWVIVNNFLK